MVTKADFTEDQWRVLAFAIEDIVMYVSVANGPKIFESISEIGASARFMSEQGKTSESTLVRDLATGAGWHRDKAMKGDSADIEATVLDRIAEAVAIVTEVAPDELDALKAFIVGVAQAAAEAKNGVDEKEANAIEKIKSALL